MEFRRRWTWEGGGDTKRERESENDGEHEHESACENEDERAKYESERVIWSPIEFLKLDCPGVVQQLTWQSITSELMDGDLVRPILRLLSVHRADFENTPRGRDADGRPDSRPDRVRTR